MKKKITLLSFMLVKFLLQYLIISPEYDLQRDEYLHLDLANHLAWGYVSVPPFTSWISAIIQLLGNSVFWVKFFPALFGALTILIVWKTIEALNGKLFALVLGGTCVLLSALLRLNMLYQPNSFDVLCWTGVYFTLVKCVKTGNKNWLFTTAVFFAFGFLNKYNILFLALGILPALLLTPQRSLLIGRPFSLSLLLAIALISPNLLWQYHHHFPVYYHLKELTDTQLVNNHLGDFLQGQLLFFIGGLVVIVAGLYALLRYSPFKKYRFFFWSMVFTIAIFIFFKAKDYYAIGIYPVYICFGAVFFEDAFSTGLKRYLQPVLLALPILFFIPEYQLSFPNKSPEYIVKHNEPYKKLGLLRWEDGKNHALPQDFADMLGWKSLAEKLDSICAGLPNLNTTLLLCDNYGEAGAINYYLKNKQLRALAFDADYINWFPQDHNITDVILVKSEYDKDPDRKEEIPLFDTVYLAGKRIDSFAREKAIAIYVLKGAKVDVNIRINAEIQRKKNE